MIAKCEYCLAPLDLTGPEPLRRPGDGSSWVIMVRTCRRCGAHYPAQPAVITYKQSRWLRRLNVANQRAGDF